MASKLKCPFCGGELDTENYYVHCHNPHCNTTVEMEGTEEMWQALIQAKQDLEQSEKCCSAWEIQALDYKAETVALSGKLEIATKALKKIESTEWYDSMSSYEIMTFTAMKALETIGKA